MTTSEYKNIIQQTLKNKKNSEIKNSLNMVRTILKNMGIPLPNGNNQEIYNIIGNNDYMLWMPCSLKEAPEMIRRDIATIGISEDKIVILLTDDILDSEEKDSLTKLDSNDIIMIINENTSDKEIGDLQLFFIQFLLHGRRKRRQRSCGRYRF